MRVEGHIQNTRVLLVERRNDRFGDVDGREAREEESVPERLGVPHGREERRHDVPRDDEGRSDARCVVYVVELVPEGLVQRYEGGFGRVVIGCGKKVSASRQRDGREDVLMRAMPTIPATDETLI